MKNDTGSSIIWPLLFAVFGIAALSTAIILVPSMARKYAEARAASAVQGPPPAAVAPPAGKPGPAAKEAVPATADPALEAKPEELALKAKPEEPALKAKPEEPASAGGPWTIELNPADYALLGDAEASIDAIAAALVHDAKARVLLTGVNSPDKSSKRALHGADLVKKKICVDPGVSPRQIETGSAQDPAVEGMIVKAEIVGGAR
jgi:hypothetical protein